MLVAYIAAGAALAGILTALVAVAKLLWERDDRAAARQRRERDVGLEATDAAFRIQGELNKRLDEENSRLLRRVAALEHEVAEKTRQFSERLEHVEQRNTVEVAALRAQIQELRRSREE